MSHKAISHRLPVDPSALETFCRRWKIVELALFGSALKEELPPQSDVDLLVSFAADAQWGLFEHVTIQEELSALIGRKVDLISRRAIERSSNPIRRNAILEAATPVYVAR